MYFVYCSYMFKHNLNTKIHTNKNIYTHMYTHKNIYTHICTHKFDRIIFCLKFPVSFFQVSKVKTYGHTSIP